jgi:hypothetical protein
MLLPNEEHSSEDSEACDTDGKNDIHGFPLMFRTCHC